MQGGSSGHSAAVEEAPSPLPRPGPQWAAGKARAVPPLALEAGRQDPGPAGWLEAPLCPGTQLPPGAAAGGRQNARTWWLRGLVDEARGAGGPVGRRGEVPGKVGPRQGLPSTTGASIAGAAWHAAEAVLSPHPWQEEHAVPGSWHESHKQTWEGVGWQPATFPRASGVRGKEGAQGLRARRPSGPCPQFQRKKGGGEQGRPRSHSTVPSTRRACFKPQHAHLEICIKDPEGRCRPPQGLLADLSTMKPPGPFSPLRRGIGGDLGARRNP